MSLQPRRQNSVVTLSSSNLFALERAESAGPDKSRASVIKRQRAFHDEPSATEIFKRYIFADFFNNLTIVTLPACFTNFLWRLMNLYGIAVSHNFWQIVGETAGEIATLVFITCFIVDACRQCILYKKQSNGSFNEILKDYYNNWGTRSSAHLGFKFFMACIFWTIGYCLIADDHQVYALKSDIDQIIYRSLGAGLGTFTGLVIAAEIIALTEYYSGILISFAKMEPYASNDNNNHNNKNNNDKIEEEQKGFCIDTNQRGVFGVGVKGFFEGVAWSIIADLDLYVIMKDKGIDENIAIILDSLTVGIFASLFFTFGGFFTSIVGYFEQNNMIKKHKRDKDIRMDEVDDIDIGPMQNDDGAEYEPLL